MEPEPIIAKSIREISAEVAALREGRHRLAHRFGRPLVRLLKHSGNPTRSRLVTLSHAFEHNTHRKNRPIAGNHPRISQPPPQAGQAQSNLVKPLNTFHTGKIARLPDAIRESLNRRLSGSKTGLSLLQWLNALPEVRGVTLHNWRSEESVFLCGGANLFLAGLPIDCGTHKDEGI